MFQARHHIDGFNLWILTVFRRANFDAQVTTGAIFRSHLQDIFLPAHITRFHIQRMQAGRAFSIASGGTTFARIAECGQAATQWLHWVQSSSFQMGISSAILRFSQRVVPIGQVPSGGSAETGRASPSPASIAAVTVFTKSGAASEPLAVDWRCADLPVATELLLRIHAPSAQSLPVAFHQILAFATVTFGNRTLQFCEALSPGRICVRWKKAICMTVLIRAARPHSRAIFAALIT